MEKQRTIFESLGLTMRQDVGEPLVVENEILEEYLVYVFMHLFAKVNYFLIIFFSS